MGGYVLTEALDRMALEGTDHLPVYENVILAAPDIDADTFEQYVAPALIKAKHRVTLYASENDAALLASRGLRGNVQVAGEVREGRVVIVNGMDTIDVSAVSSGHSYIGDNGHVLEDFRALLRGAKAAAERAAKTGLKPMVGGWWQLSAKRELTKTDRTPASHGRYRVRHAWVARLRFGRGRCGGHLGRPATQAKHATVGIRPETRNLKPSRPRSESKDSGATVDVDALLEKFRSDSRDERKPAAAALAELGAKAVPAIRSVLRDGLAGGSPAAP